MHRILILSSALVVAFGYVACLAQDRVLAERYRDFGLFQKLDLAATYFTNPTEAQRASVAYFVPLKGEEPSENVLLLLKEGEAHYSITEGDDIYKIIDPSYSPTAQELRGGVVGLITDDKEALENFQWSPVVSWGEIKPIDISTQNPQKDE